ncbi:multidrug effflux MFS transporter [Oceanobacillus rekensis]|uniref:multidrug effflux MFS transporter n=1 Tax=Oceanobacillus rekensis TaxID=937927 RepID=UPI00159399EC|nr:multidrug effflux MFS transporter [Oceanobacillus rekensis]
MLSKERKTDKYKLRLVFVLGLLTAFGAVSMDMYLPALPNVAADLDASTSLVQMSLTACLVGLGLGQVFFGPLSDIYGRRNLLIITLIGYTIASLLIAWSTTIAFFITLRFIQGFTGAAGVVIARAAARDLYSGKDLTKFLALLALVNGSAPILAPVIGGVVLNFTTWIGVFYVLAFIGIVALLAVLLFLPETLADENRAERGLFSVLKTFSTLLTNRYFMGIALTQGLVMASMFAYIAGSPFILQNIYGVSPQQFSFLFALNGIGIIIAAQLTGRLASYFKEMHLLCAGTLLSFTGSLFLAFVVWQQLPLFYMAIALFLIVSSVGIVTTTSFSLAMETQGKSAGSASAFLGLLPFVFGGIVAPLVGLAGEASAIPMAIVIFTCSTIAVIMFFIAFKKD